jgi:hypothetical protein
MTDRLTPAKIASLRMVWSPDARFKRHGATLVNQLIDEIERLNAKLEQADGELVKRLTLPPWGEVETEMRELYHSAPPRAVEGGPSMHTGLQAVYGRIQDTLALELVLARAVMAGDEDGEPVPVASEQDETPAAEGGWPPRAGDVWRDAQGDDWHAIDTKFGVQMRLDGTAGYNAPWHVLHNYGPLQLVKR